MSNMITLIIISGRSGSGKSTALHVLEDMGYYCIDNLPVTLLEPLIERLSREQKITHLALGIDARNLAGDLSLFPDIYQRLDAPRMKSAMLPTVIYLDAASPTLVKRFSETRRKHPLSDDNRDLRESLELETQLLDPISNLASLKIDTTSLTIHELREEIRTRVARQEAEFALLFVSFAYKRGVPVDADLVFDVRCLPNPHWEPELRELTGLDAEVQTFLQAQPAFADMSRDIQQYLMRWLPEFEANNRSYLTVAVGCTGGQHRSVFMCQQLFSRFKTEFGNVQVRHRELNRMSSTTRSTTEITAEAAAKTGEEKETAG